MLAVGYDNRDGTRPLYYAEIEAQHVAALLKGEAWVSSETKSTRLLADAPKYARLHIAGHAFFNPKDPLGSTLLLGPEDMLSARQILQQLTLNVSLVTLSSCTSGVSDVVPGDELLGLQRAFLYAGAPTIVCTRWEANDLIALLIMDRFYRELRRCRPATALRNAQVAVREMTLDKVRNVIARWQKQGYPIAAHFTHAEEIVRATRATLVPLDSEAIAATLDTWRSEMTEQSTHEQTYDSETPQKPFAGLEFWASFMTIGRA